MGAKIKSVNAVGAVVYWSVSDTDRAMLGVSLTDLNLGQFLPNKRTPSSSLFNALKATGAGDKYGDSWLVHPLKASSMGFEVVKVSKGDKSNAYEPLFTAFVTDTEQITLGEGLWDFSVLSSFQHSIRKSYLKMRETLTGSSVGSCLVDICSHLRGTGLRDSGGVYWLPEDAVDSWDKVGEAVSDASFDSSNVYRLRTLMDESAATAVIDAITSEVDTQSNEILEGIGELGERALRTREEQSRELKRKVEHYEQMLGEGLDRLKSVCDIATKSASHAVLAQL